MKLNELFGLLEKKDKKILGFIVGILLIEILLLLGLSYTVNQLINSFSDFDLFLKWIGLFFLLSVVIELLVNFKEFKFITIMAIITHGIQMRLIETYIDSFSSESSYYFLEQKVSRAIQNIGQLIIKSLTLFKIIIFGALIILELKLFALVLPVFIIFAVLSSRKTNTLMNYWESLYRDSQRKLIHQQRQVITGRTDIRQFKYMSSFEKDYSDLLNKSLNVEKSYLKKIRGQIFGINISNILLFIVLLFIGVFMHLNHQYPLESVMFLIFLFYQIQANYTEGYNLMLAMYEVIIFGSEVKNLTQNKFEQFDDSLEFPIKTIELNNLEIPFEDCFLTIENFVKVECGIPLLLKGKNGSGKTTLLKVICSLISNFQGTILINNEISSNSVLQALSQYCQLTSNESLVFDNSVLRNIVLDKETNLRLLDEIARKVFLQDVFDLSCEENWNINASKYSLGIQQRILIARSMYQNKHINLFDEALDNIDKTRRKKILRNIKHHFGNKLLIFSSHDLETFSDMNTIEIKSKINKIIPKE